VELFIEAGLPAGVLNFVTGGGSTVGEEITTNPAVRAVSFTGSTQVGQGIHRKAALIMAKTQLEMGGKNALVVLEDCDLEQAIASAAKAAYACAGQWCTSTSRAIVVCDVAEPFIDGVAAAARELVVGNGMDERSTMGPVCGKVQKQSILRHVEAGKEDGATLLIGGRAATGDGRENGCFIEPTIFTNVTPDMRIARQEIFGPVLSIMVVKDFDEALEVANSVDYGLASSVYTTDLERALTFVERSDVGLTHVNLMTALKEPQLSFGGVKGSGFGIPEAGATGIEFFAEHKVAYIKYR
jgi:aldehyde dehydrogenase (NAD+)